MYSGSAVLSGSCTAAAAPADMTHIRFGETTTVRQHAKEPIIVEGSMQGSQSQLRAACEGANHSQGRPLFEGANHSRERPEREPIKSMTVEEEHFRSKATGRGKPITLKRCNKGEQSQSRVLVSGANHFRISNL